jgi:glucan 1,4-alpha-glucosidase
MAPGGPGADSHFDLSRKDCLGTARNSTSKVWFTVADGVLSDVYYPTVDNTNVETLQYVVTDGRSFTDLQTRDMTYTVTPLDTRALACRITATARNRRYRIITDYVTDSEHDSVDMYIRFEALRGARSGYRLYIRYDPSINGNGGGGVTNTGGDSGAVLQVRGRGIPIAYDRNTQSEATNRTYAVPVYSALAASRSFRAVENGFVGTPSDGLAQLDRVHRLIAAYNMAKDGNLVQTVEIGSPPPAFDLALGFGSSAGRAAGAATGTIKRGFKAVRRQYESLWHTYDRGLRRPQPSVAGIGAAGWRRLVNEYYLSANVLKASEDKTFSGAILASMTAPWGQAVLADSPGDAFYSGYREVWARDLYEIWTALFTDGDRNTAGQALGFMFFRQQQPDGSFPRNSLINGLPAPDSSGLQMDECAYPIIMADQMGWNSHRFYKRHIKTDADFIVNNGPATGAERWEDQSGYSPSTIAAEIAGLVAAADIARKSHDYRSANLWQAVADQWRRSIREWTVTTNGPLAHHPYFIRLSKTGNANASVYYNVGNGGPTLDQRAIVDQGFLDFVRLGVLSARDKYVTESLPVVDRSIERHTASGPGWLRFTDDGYGDAAGTGVPWVTPFAGTGHPWPVLTGERAEYDLAAGRHSRAIALLETMRRFASPLGLIPEQDWDTRNLPAAPFGTDSGTASIGFRNGQPDGSAGPLSWAEGQYVRLFLGVAAGQVVEQPSKVAERYLHQRHPQARLRLLGLSDQSIVHRSRLLVRGQAPSGARVLVATNNIAGTSSTIITAVRAGTHGKFRLGVNLPSGATVLTIVVNGRNGATAEVQRTIFYE